MIVDPFETCSADTEEIAKYVTQIENIFLKYNDLKEISELKFDLLIDEYRDDNERVAILEEFKRSFFPVIVKRSLL